jgi:putative tryptophan/tyrosine transport system substrate-binding protein
MKRRDFITLLGSAVAWPLAARAQQPERMRRIGVLSGGGVADDPDAQGYIGAFLQELQQLGWTEGGNMRIDTRWGAGNADNLRKYSVEMAALAPDVILTVGTASMGVLSGGGVADDPDARYGALHRAGAGQVQQLLARLGSRSP